LCQRLLGDVKLYALLDYCDADLAETVREGRCRMCGGPLHSARYPRKPRGYGPASTAQDARRQSYCCEIDGCRTRHTPPSVRFLGRRVFGSVVVVLVCALAQGLSSARVRELRESLGVSRRTLARWRAWWLQVVPSSSFWQRARSRFPVPVDPTALPSSLLERFMPLTTADPERLLALLRFLTPLTTSRHSRGA
jgi:hypothetical protein